MITNNELNIANTSYTNKDFQSIYNEILELAQKISNRWNPDQSNESDPGIVLLKLMSFIADKNNYNIDKNVLEAFMPSATQVSSMRKLCEMNGYNMKYYNSASTSVKFMYIGSDDALKNSTTFTMTLPAFTTTLTNEDGDVTFTLTQDCTLSEKNFAQSVTCIEGTIQNLTVNDSDVLHLSALDDNNRIYFNVENVAENGVYIYRENELGSYWTPVDNLNNQELGSTVYKFGYDSINSLPYVEFPNDIASLIGSGIHIKYIETTGEDGNISANVLTKLSSTTSVDVLLADGTLATINLSTDNLLINNSSSTNNGCDPESIDDAYSNFKKTVGTFDTLVTCRDYMNAIYNMTDDSNNYLVSNCQVTDRRTDYNYSNNILVSDDSSTYIKSYTDNSSITPYDLCCYPLTSLTTSYNSSTYNNSFKVSYSTQSLIEGMLDDEKCISHTFKTLNNDDVYAFKNYYSLQATISTTYKVNTYEQNEILSNVYDALYRNFYARQLEYGQEIPFDSILSVIEEADTRIKSVSLLEPVLNTKVLKKDNSEVDFDVTTSIDYVIPYLAKNILSGKISLFSFDNRFVNTYGQSSSTIHEKLISASTEVEIPTSIDYTIRENEVVQLIAPSYITDISYPAYVNYRYVGNSGSVLKKDVIHKLTATETLRLNWTDSESVVHNVEYKEGDIVRPNFDVSVTDKGTIIKENESYDQLGVNDEIEHLVPSSYEIKSSSLPCYWILNSGRTLFKSGVNDEIILQDNEYFFYSNSALTEMVTLGSGTRLKLNTHETSYDWTISENESILSADDIMSNGISAFSGLNWKYKSGFDSITVDEMQIITLTEGMNVNIHDTTKSLINNTFTQTNKDISPVITYTQDGTSTDVQQIQVDENSTWQIRSRLDLNASSTKGQLVQDRQAIEFTYKKEDDTEDKFNVTVGQYIKFNTTVQFSGNANIDLQVTDLATGETSNSVNCLTYSYSDSEVTISGVSKTDESLTIDFSKLSNKREVTIPLNVINKDSINIIPLYLSHVTNTSLNYSLTLYRDTTKLSSCIRLYNNGAYADSVNITSTKMYNVEIKFPDTTSKYYLKISVNADSSDTMKINNIVTVTSINPKLGLTTDTQKNQLLSKIRELDGNNNFYYMNTSTSIDVDNMLSPRALFDVNNVANNMTISQIDTTSLGKINIARTSKQ